MEEVLDSDGAGAVDVDGCDALRDPANELSEVLVGADPAPNPDPPDDEAEASWVKLPVVRDAPDPRLVVAAVPFLARSWSGDVPAALPPL